MFARENACKSEKFGVSFETSDSIKEGEGGGNQGYQWQVAEFYWVVLVGGGDVEKHVQGLEIVEDRA